MGLKKFWKPPKEMSLEESKEVRLQNGSRAGVSDDSVKRKLKFDSFRGYASNKSKKSITPIVPQGEENGDSYQSYDETEGQNGYSSYQSQTLASQGYGSYQTSSKQRSASYQTPSYERSNSYQSTSYERSNSYQSPSYGRSTSYQTPTTTERLASYQSPAAAERSDSYQNPSAGRSGSYQSYQSQKYDPYKESKEATSNAYQNPESNYSSYNSYDKESNFNSYDPYGDNQTLKTSQTKTNTTINDFNKYEAYDPYDDSTTVNNNNNNNNNNDLADDMQQLQLKENKNEKQDLEQKYEQDQYQDQEFDPYGPASTIPITTTATTANDGINFNDYAPPEYDEFQDYDQGEFTQELDEDEAELARITRQTKDLREDTVNVSSNIVNNLKQGNVTALNSLGVLGAQREKIYTMERKMNNIEDVQEETTEHIKQLNHYRRPLYHIKINNPLTKAKRARAREAAMERKLNEQDAREQQTNANLYASQNALVSQFNNESSNVQSELKEKYEYERRIKEAQRYLTSDHDQEDADMENQIASNLEDAIKEAERLKSKAVAMSEEISKQNEDLQNLSERTTTANHRVLKATTRLRGI